MAKKQCSGLRYKYPLPIHPIDSLPQLIPHNPVSWLHWIISYCSSINELQKKISVEILGEQYVHILVKDPREMLYLWNNGFFGTGQMSRSEPTWRNRTSTRMGEVDVEMEHKRSNMPLESITKKRRLQRVEFKKRRQTLEDQLLELRRQGGTIEEEGKLLESEREELRNFKEQQFQTFVPNNEVQLRAEDSELFDENGKICNLELLELSFVEALFLSFALPVLDISPYTLIERSLGPIENLEYQTLYPLIKQYVAYHHYRSHGWCVRSGIKFGCDFLLYKRGPPFQHAPFCIKVLDVNETHDYTWFSSLARVVGSTKKTLVLCYVRNTAAEMHVMQLLKQRNLTKVFSSHEVSEVIYRRWVPGKNRD